MATQLLQAFSWNVEQAVDSFFNDGVPDEMDDDDEPTPAVNTTAVTKLFEKYKDAKQELIDVDGMQRFCDDLGVDPGDIVMLVVAWRLNATAMCQFTRAGESARCTVAIARAGLEEISRTHPVALFLTALTLSPPCAEFVTGMSRLGCDSIASLKQKLPALRRELDDPASFQSIYNYAYEYARSSESTQKSLALETAVEMWQLVLAGKFALLDQWTEFLKAEATHSITKDTWSLFYDFVKTAEPDLSNYDDDGEAGAGHACDGARHASTAAQRRPASTPRRPLF